MIVPSGHGRSRKGAITTSRAIMRLGLLDNLIEARRSADRGRADEVLVEANRWLRRHTFDIREAGARDPWTQMTREKPTGRGRTLRHKASWFLSGARPTKACFGGAVGAR